MKKAFRSILSIMLAVIVVAGVMAPVAPTVSAIEFERFRGDSDMWLVDANTKNTSSTIYLYGRADYICLKLKQDSGYYSRFYFEMYSDSKYTKEVASYSTLSESGTKYVMLPIAFDDLKSGTYYVKTYVYKETFRSDYYYRETDIDPDTERTYKVVIKKSGTDIDDMNTVMYGYENTEKGPRIYWYSVPGATGYYLYRKNPKTGKYSKIKTIKDSGKKLTSYVDETYKGKNATRYYKVVAYKGSLKTPSSLKSLKVKAYKAPTVKAEVISDNRIKISWSKVAGGAKYTLYSRHNDSDTWEKVKTTSSRSYVLNAKDFENNEIYRFTVIAKVNDISSGYNTKGIALRYLEYPELKDCTYPDDGGITVNWKKVSGADRYIIYRKNSKKDDWQELCTVKGGSKTKYTDLTANNEDYYYYTVRSVRGSVNGSLNKDGIPATILTAPVLTGFTELDGQSVRINWEKLPNKCEYEVLRKTTAGWKKIATTENNYYDYNFKSKIADETFTVRATRGAFTSDFDKTGISYSSYPKVVITDIEAAEDKVVLAWKNPTNAGNSIVYKQIEDGEFVEIANTNETTLVDNSVETGVKYTYKIAYYYNDNVIEEAASEKTIKLNTDVVERESVAYNTTLSYNTKSFTTKIKDYDQLSEYRVYRETEDGWIRLTSSITEQGEITVRSNDFGNVESFAIVKISPEGDYRIITESDFTVEFVSDYIPETLASASVENGYPTVTWDYDSTKTADNIHIYRKAPDSKNKYKLVGIVPVTQTTFVDESAKANYVYDYQLRVEKDGFVTHGGPVAQVNYMGTPEIKYHNFKKAEIQLSWQDISRATKYRVYRKTVGDTEWVRLKTTTNTFYTDKSITPFVEYLYMVKAVDENDNVGPGNSNPSPWKYVPSVKNFTTKKVDDTFVLKWDEVDGADGYIITYQDRRLTTTKNVGGPVTIKVKGGNKTQYIQKDIPAAAIAREYEIVAYSDYATSDDTEGYLGYLKQPQITKLTSESNGVKLRFSSVKGVDYYYIYRKAPGAKEWKYYDKTENKYFVDYNVKEGKKYSYTVRAKNSFFGDNYYSTYDKTGWSITYNP